MTKKEELWAIKGPGGGIFAHYIRTSQQRAWWSVMAHLGQSEKNLKALGYTAIRVSIEEID